MIHRCGYPAAAIAQAKLAPLAHRTDVADLPYGTKLDPNNCQVIGSLNRFPSMLANRVSVPITN